MSLREMAASAVCGGLLLSILIPAGWMMAQWAERQERQLLERMVWREPLDEWIGFLHPCTSNQILAE
jgi:hypothetical protein